MKKKVSLRINNRELFGAFCEALTIDKVPFNHAGFYTVVIDIKALRILPPKSRSRDLFDKFSKQGAIQMLSTVSPSEKRSRLPSQTEAEESLRKFIGRG